MKVRTIKTNHFPDDTFRRIEILISDRWYPVIGIYKEDGCWANDTNGRTFDTIAEAKEYAVKFYNSNIK